VLIPRLDAVQIEIDLILRAKKNFKKEIEDCRPRFIPYQKKTIISRLSTSARVIPARCLA
jgi:hypothetical protein